MDHGKLPLSLSLLAALLGCAAPEESMQQRAERLALETIIVDTHIDVPYRLGERPDDVSRATASGDFDYPRAVAGGLNAPFMSIYVPASYQTDGGAKAFADGLIDMMQGLAAEHPDKFAIAVSPADVREQFERGVVSLPLGMENGAPLEGELANLQHFFDRGIRYITLTHSENNAICDSSYADEPKWNGLSPFGEQVVAEMNRLGMMIDVSHVTDAAFYRVMELSAAPAIASHSSCRKFTPGWERNMDDDMIRLLAQNGGVIQINFGSAFLAQRYLDEERGQREKVRAVFEEHGWRPDQEEARAFVERYRADNPIEKVPLSVVADHIDHVVAIAGIDHVGIGSDYDGVGDSLPVGLEDVSKYPNLIAELLRRGYGDDDVRKICSGNVLRVWEEVERVAAGH